MKNLVCLLILTYSISANATCDFKTGIVPQANDNFLYSGECHRKVGSLVQDSLVKDQQIEDLYKAVDLKNASLSLADQRTKLWMDAAESSQEHLDKVESNRKQSDYLIFGLGILTAVAVGMATARLIGR